MKRAIATTENTLKKEDASDNLDDESDDWDSNRSNGSFRRKDNDNENNEDNEDEASTSSDARLRRVNSVEMEKDGIMKLSSASSETTNAVSSSPSRSGSPRTLEEQQRVSSEDFWQTIAGVAGNVLEWYDFAVFGYLGDVIGQVFFPPQTADWATIEAFAVFGAAFFMRPIGGIIMGYIGDVYGRDRALIISIFLMAFPTFFMGCLPSYERAGMWSIILLILIRLLQGLSVGGQLMSSLVFTLENHDKSQWGLYGSFVMAAANCGTLLGGVVSFVLRACLTPDELVAWGWRLPFLSGILVSFSGFYLSNHATHHPTPYQHEQEEQQNVDHILSQDPKLKSPIAIAFSKGNRRSLLCAILVPMIWSGGFYLAFVWFAVFMASMDENPINHAFGINSLSLLVSVCCFFPIAGRMSDRIGRVPIMRVGGVAVALLAPLVVYLVNRGNSVLTFFSQSLLGLSLSCWGAPMCAWLVEAFGPEARLTSVSIGYNFAHAIAGGLTPSFATLLVDQLGPFSPGLLFSILAILSLTGLALAPSNEALSGVASTSARNVRFKTHVASLVPTNDIDEENRNGRHHESTEDFDSQELRQENDLI